MRRSLTSEPCVRTVCSKTNADVLPMIQSVLLFRHRLVSVYPSEHPHFGAITKTTSARLTESVKSMRLLPVKQAVSNATTYLIPSYKEFPNSSLHNLPLIIYRPFEDAENNGRTSLDPAEIEKLLEKNGLTPAWRYGM